LIAVSAVLAVGGVRAPGLALIAVGGLAGVTLMVSRLPFALAVLVASFFFENYLSSGVGLLTPAKVIGLVAISAWLVDWAVGRHRMVVTRELRWALGLLLWVVVAMSAARNEHVAVVTTLRYVSFVSLFFLVLQTVRGRIKDADRLATVAMSAALAASILGLLAFFRGQVDRVSGPLEDPNDFGFLLASTLPLAVYCARRAQTVMGRSAAVISLLAISIAVLLTFSRSALVGVAMAAIWALGTRRVRLRWGVAGLAGLVFAGFAAYLIQPAAVSSAFSRKQHVADTNVSIRLTLWDVAWREFRSLPLTGVGPGNYVSRFEEFGSTPSSDQSTFTTHNAYLNVLAELGGPGFLLFCGFLVSSWRRLRQRPEGDPDTDQLLTALAAGYVVALVGSMFLTEQYYPPLWFFAALGVSMIAVPRTDEPQPVQGNPGAGRGR